MLFVASGSAVYSCAVNNYGLILGTAHYHMILISQCCNFYAYELFI